MATITKPNTFSSAATIVASEHNDNFDTIYNDYNGSINNANLASNAAIVDTKLATIDTGSKVNLSALVITSQTAGDVIYASSATVLTRLAAGTSGNLLRSAGTAAPTWSNTLPTGSVVQIVNVQSGALITGTTPIPNDDTVPASDEGAELMTLAVTPVGSGNSLKIDSVVQMAAHAANLLGGAALYQDATTAAIAGARNEQTAAANSISTYSFTHFMTAATTAETTFKIRAGFSAAHTLTFNGLGGGRKWGGALASSITITEIQA